MVIIPPTMYRLNTSSGWWFPPIWKILVKYSQIGLFPQVGTKITNTWNDHLVWILIMSPSYFMTCPKMSPFMLQCKFFIPRACGIVKCPGLILLITTQTTQNPFRKLPYSLRPIIAMPQWNLNALGIEFTSKKTHSHLKQIRQMAPISPSFSSSQIWKLTCSAIVTRPNRTVRLLVSSKHPSIFHTLQGIAKGGDLHQKATKIWGNSTHGKASRVRCFVSFRGI